MRNFDWQRDELILAFDLYIRTRPAARSPIMREIILLARRAELSNTSRGLAL